MSKKSTSSPWGPQFGVLQDDQVTLAGQGPILSLPVLPDETQGAKDGDIVRFLLVQPDGQSAYHAKITRRYRNVSSLEDLAAIALCEHDLPVDFSDEAMAEVAAIREAPPLPPPDPDDAEFMCIDQDIAKEYDDAVWAGPDPTADNPDGYRIRIAVADVARYVLPGSALDQAARQRCHALYFPREQVPMLPAELAYDLGSLRAGEPRAALITELRFNPDGERVDTQFRRATIVAAECLTYAEFDKRWEADRKNDTRVQNLIGALPYLRKARKTRNSMTASVMPRKVSFQDDSAEVDNVEPEPMFNSYEIIEEFLLLANLAAADVLVAGNAPFLARFNETPKQEQLDQLTEHLGLLGLPGEWRFDADGIEPTDLSTVLTAAEKAGMIEPVTALMRGMLGRPVYAPTPKRHFALDLPHYSHAVAPLRRYADIVVHRAVIKQCELPGPGGHFENHYKLRKLGKTIAEREDVAAAAVHHTFDRYTAHYLEQFKGQVFGGIVHSVMPPGLLVTIDGVRVEGFVPSYHPDCELRWNDAEQSFDNPFGEQPLRAGTRVRVRLTRTCTINGGVELELTDETVH